MTEAEELQWLREWRTRLVSAMRMWWRAPTYAKSCSGWDQVKAVLAEDPTNNPDYRMEGRE